MDLMQIRRRMMAQTKKNRLPDGYRELECITGTGGQYLDTGIRPQVGDALEITFYSNASGDDLRPFGAYTPGVAIDGHNGMRIITSSFDSVYAYIGGGRKSTVECTADGTWSLNGAVVTSDLPIQSNNNLTISIFKARYNNNRLYGTGEMTLYGFKYYRSGSAIADYVPCEEIATGNIGVYDLVSGTFVGNAGTGTFTT